MPGIWLGRHFSHQLGSMPLMKARREPSSDRRQPKTAYRHSAVEAGAAAGSEVRALDTSRFDKLMTRPEFGEFWRVHVILLCDGFWHLVRIYSQMEKHNKLHGQISFLFYKDLPGAVRYLLIKNPRCTHMLYIYKYLCYTHLNTDFPRDWRPNACYTVFYFIFYTSFSLRAT
jgi:hypothetical protein